MNKRRSERLKLSVPVHISSLEPFVIFTGRCNTVDVSCHGCVILASYPFKPATRLLMTTLPRSMNLSVHVIRAVPAWPEVDTNVWKIAVELDVPGNVWDIHTPPKDWINGKIQKAS